MKIFRIFFIVIMAVCTLALFSCGGGGEEALDAPTFTVIFESNGGSAIEPLTVSQGAKITQPDDPDPDPITSIEKCNF